jgi:hypothetical protein
MWFDVQQSRRAPLEQAAGGIFVTTAALEASINQHLEQ